MGRRGGASRCRSSSFRRVALRRSLADQGRRSGLLFLLFARLHRRWALLETETMRLADHRVSADSAQFVGDLARGRAIVPHLLQALDALFGPRHSLIYSNPGPALRASPSTDRR